MTNLEYRDLYRFVISLGFALLALSVAAPWLFFREGFDLYVTLERLNQLTPRARGIIEHRQKTAGLLIYVIPVASFLMALVGSIMIGVGIRRWQPRQRLLDEEESLRIAKARHEVTALTPHQVATKASAEISAAEESTSAALQEQPVPEQEEVDRYLRVEAAVGDAVQKCLGRNYVVLRDRRIGPAFYDIIVQHRSGDGPDLAIEVKYAKRGFKYGWVNESTLRAVIAATLYAKETGNVTRAIVVFVAPQEALQRSPVANYERQFQAELDMRGVEASLVFLPEEELSTLSCERLEEITGFVSPR